MTKLAEVRASANVTNGSAAASDLELSCDVCVIGSGAGGAVTAATLAAAGVDVLIVEEGGYWTNSDFTMREKDVVSKLYQEAMQRATADGAIAILQGRAVGGTTVVNYTTSFRTPEHVVDHWKKKHGVTGFTHADLGPHWDWIEKRLAIHKVSEEEMNLNNRKLFEGFKAMGWQADTLRLRVSAPPLEGRANDAVVQLIARGAGVAPGAVSVVAGARGRDKLVRVAGVTPDALRARLGA